MKNQTWYYHKNLKPQGPMSLADMRALIRSGEVKPQDLICYELDGEWKPAVTWSIFERTLFPATQEFIPGKTPNPEDKEWVLLVPEQNGRNILQEGPYSLKDLQIRLQRQEISEQHYIWKNGLSGWCRIADRPEFQELVF